MHLQAPAQLLNRLPASEIYRNGIHLEMKDLYFVYKNVVWGDKALKASKALSWVSRENRV